MRRRAAIAAAGLTLAAAALWPSAAGAGWNQPVGGPSPLNESDSRDAQAPSLAVVGDVPFVAWSEFDGSNDEIRVARMSDAGDDWVQPRSTIAVNGGGVNQSDVRDAFNGNIAAVGGVPYVAWLEDDGTNREVRVARLTQTVFGPRWRQPWTGVSDASGGINRSTSRSAQSPSLASVGGVPHVAWTEPDGTNTEIRVARLNAAGTAWEEPWTGVSGTYGGINASTALSGFRPSVADIGGVAHVAWQERDGVNDEIRVSRLSGSTWQELEGGASPINHDGTSTAGGASLADVGGVPHVAWTEFDGSGSEVRVSRLSTAGADDWRELVGGPSPVNFDGTRDAAQASLVGIGGVPYVAWQESDGTNSEIRVARLNAAGSAWEQVVGGPSPINEADNRLAFLPSIAAVGGLPWIAWDEGDGVNREARVARLEPEFGAVTATPSETGATLTTAVRTFGLPFPIGFQFGPALENETAVEPAPAGAGDIAVSRQVSGLGQATSHRFRPFATVGVPAPRVLGTEGAFTTTSAPQRLVLSDLRVSPSVFRAAARGRSVTARRRRIGTRVRYTLSAPATVRFTVERAAKGRRSRGRCRRPTRGNRRARWCVRFVALRGSFVHTGAAGPNSLRFSGRMRGGKLRPGRHRLAARAVDIAGRRSPLLRRSFRIVRR